MICLFTTENRRRFIHSASPPLATGGGEDVISVITKKPNLARSTSKQFKKIKFGAGIMGQCWSYCMWCQHPLLQPQFKSWMPHSIYRFLLIYLERKQMLVKTLDHLLSMWDTRIELLASADPSCSLWQFGEWIMRAAMADRLGHVQCRRFSTSVPYAFSPKT